jgi:D-alanyl-D-alanine carboxypeptidase
MVTMSCGGSNCLYLKVLERPGLALLGEERSQRTIAMKKGRLALVLLASFLVAIIIALVTFIVVKFVIIPRLTPADIPPPQQEPVLPPAAEPELPPESKQDVDKSKEAIKPIKPVPPQTKVQPLEELGPGKVRLCSKSKDVAVIASDGRLLGHRPYDDAQRTELASAPAGFNSGSCSQMHGEAKVALEKLIAGARITDPALADAMVGLSCFRSSTYQREVFCRKVSDGVAVRARASAPPGYSEHATGYAIDFGDRNIPECNLNACFETTPVGTWLAANAGQYGFVMSFPKGNSQGVMYEPWHWRFQGSRASQTTFEAAN